MLTETTPAALTMAPIGALISLADMHAGDVAWCGDDEVTIAVDHQGRPAVCDDAEHVLSRWIAEHSSPGMFEVLGTSGDLEQGCIATGAADNWLLLTDTYLRASIPSGGSQLKTAQGVGGIPQGSVFSLVLPLIDIEVIDGNKHDIALGSALDGVIAKWVRGADNRWQKVPTGNPWRRDNTEFAQAVLAATITAKSTHTDEKTRASAENARTANTRAFATRKRTTFEFASPD